MYLSTVNTTAMPVGIKSNVITERFITSVEWEMVQKEIKGFNERDELTIKHKTDGEVNFNQLGFRRGYILGYIQKPVEKPHLENIKPEAKNYLVNGYILKDM